MDQKLVFANQGAAKVTIILVREKLPLYEKPVAAETIFTIIDYQTECLDADGVRLGEAVASLHL